jgi:hypothetical protein
MPDPSPDSEVITACTDLFVDYARYVDFGEYDSFVELFTDDAVLDLGFRLQGKERIKKSMSKRDPELRSRHIMTNISIDVIDAQTAHGIAYLTLYRHIGPETLSATAINLQGPAGVGHYSNTFTLTTDGWRISSCQLEFAFSDPAQFS